MTEECQIAQGKKLRHYRTPLRYDVDDTARFIMAPHSIGPICSWGIGSVSVRIFHHSQEQIDARPICSWE